MAGEAFSFKLEGWAELINMFEQLPTVAMQKTVVRNSLKKAAQPILDAAIDGVPIEEGYLKKSLVISTSLKKSQKKYRPKDSSVTVYVGTGEKSGYLVEFGTDPRFDDKGKFTGVMPQNPFMRRAWDTMRQTAFMIIKQEFEKNILRAAKRLARKAGKGTLTQKQISGLLK